MERNALAQALPQGRGGELRRWTPGIIDNMRWYASKALAPLFGGDQKAANAYYMDKVQPTAEFLPGIGDAMAAGEAVDAFKGGNYGTGAILAAGAAAGLVPGVGDAAAKGIKSLVKQRGDEVLGLLKSGRADQVADEMLDLGNAADNANLNAYLFENYDLPMDDASRMARAGEMGLDADAYHASNAKEQFSTFKPGMWGSTYLAASPKRAEIGAQSGAQELMHLHGGTDGMRTVSVMPMKIDAGQVRGLRPSKTEWDRLPETAVDSEVDRLAQRVGGRSWSDVYDEIVVRQPKWDAKGNLIDAGEYTYQKRAYPAQSYTPDSKEWTPSNPMLAGYNSKSDAPSLAKSKEMGQSAFLVSDEAGPSIVAGSEFPIRSRFARFDPRLKHLRNLSAGVGGGALMLNYLANQQQPPEQY